MTATTAAKKPEGKGKPARKLPAAPESKLKFSKKQVSKRATLIKRKLERSAVIALGKRKNFVRAEKISTTLAFVIRIRGINKVAQKVRKVLQLFRVH